jgi:hypothetical protein
VLDIADRLNFEAIKYQTQLGANPAFFITRSRNAADEDNHRPPRIVAPASHRSEIVITLQR